MPLSEQEQRLLDEMERHLMHNDADVVSTAAGERAFSYKRIVLGTLLVLAGLGGLIVGVSTQLIVVGVIAFAAMVAGVILAATPTRVTTPRTAARAARPKSSAPQASFMDRMNDRWDKRHDGQ